MVRIIRSLLLVVHLHVAGEAADVSHGATVLLSGGSSSSSGRVLIRCRRSSEGVRGRKSLLLLMLMLLEEVLLLRMDAREHVRSRVDTLTLRVQARVERSRSLLTVASWLRLLLRRQVAATVLSQ